MAGEVGEVEGAETVRTYCMREIEYIYIYMTIRAMKENEAR